jgi:hypothetical protein
MNEVLGGGFSSRLFQNLRTKQGLAYSVGGGIGSAWDHLGMTGIEMGTKSASTVEGIKGIWQQLDELHSSPPTEEELSRGKDSILNSFIFRFDTPVKVLRERMAYEYYGYPADWLERYRSAVDKVTTADVKRVIDKYVHKDQLAVLVVGNAGQFKPALNTLGSVKDIDITIPPPPGAGKSEKPAASNPEGKALIGKVVEFLGGADKLKSVKALRYSATSTRISPQGEIPIETEVTVAFPDKLMSSMSAMGNEMKIVITPTAGFRVAGGEVADMPESMRADALQTAKQQVYNVAQHAEDPGYVFAADGTEKIGNTEAAVLNISGDGAAFRWLVNPATGELVEAISEVNGGRQGPTERTITFSDWKMVDGVNLYNMRTISEGGAVVAKDAIKSWTVNPTVDPKTFEKPAQTPAL